MALPAVSLHTSERGQMAIILIGESIDHMPLTDDDEAKVTLTLQALSRYFFSEASPNQKEQIKDLVSNHTVQLREFLAKDIKLVLPEGKTFMERSLLLVQMVHFSDLIEKNGSPLHIKQGEGTLQLLIFLLEYTDWEYAHHRLVMTMLSELSEFYHNHATSEQKSIIHGLISDHYSTVKQYISYDKNLVVNINRPIKLRVQSLILHYYGIKVTKDVMVNELDQLISYLSIFICNKDLRDPYKKTITDILDSITEYAFKEATDREWSRIKSLVTFIAKEKQLGLFRRSIKFKFAKDFSYEEAPLFLINFPKLFRLINDHLQDESIKIDTPRAFLEFYAHMTKKRRWESKYKSIFFSLFKSLSKYYYNESSESKKKEIESAFLENAEDLIPHLPEDFTIKMPTFHYKKTSVSFKVSSFILLFDPTLKGKTTVEFKTKEEIRAFLNNLENVGITLSLPSQVAISE